MTQRMDARILGCLAGGGAALLPGAALAHPGVHAVGHGASFTNGLLHPLMGADHLVAMVAIGLWAAYLGGRALLGVPLAFLGMMIAGAVLGHASTALPAVDQMIAVSLVVFGLLICLLAKLPPGLAALIAGLFATFHGYAHGAEIPDAAGPLLYGAGFILATAILLVFGSAIGLASRSLVPGFVVRGAGAAIAAFGFVAIAGQLA